MDEAKASFRHLYGQLSTRDKANFVQWIEEEFMNNNQLTDAHCAASNRASNAEAIMRAAAEEIRMQVPIDAVLRSETIVAPERGERGTGGDYDGAEGMDDDSIFDADTSVHVDSFLYDDDAIDDLVEEGKFSRHYCTKCLSRCQYMWHFLMSPRCAFEACMYHVSLVIYFYFYSILFYSILLCSGRCPF